MRLCILGIPDVLGGEEIVSIPTPPDLSTENGRRELALDTMGSFALEGMYPSEEVLGYVADYIAGRLTPAEIIARLDVKYGVVRD